MTPAERFVIYLMAATLGVAFGWWLAYTIGFTL
jgi:hypothetical protein